MVCRFFCLVHATTIYFELYFATGMTEINEETKRRLAYYWHTTEILILGVMPKGPASGLGIPDGLIELHGGSLVCIPRLICRAGSHNHSGVDDVSGEKQMLSTRRGPISAYGSIYVRGVRIREQGKSRPLNTKHSSGRCQSESSSRIRHMRRDLLRWRKRAVRATRGTVLRNTPVSYRLLGWGQGLSLSH